MRILVADDEKNIRSSIAALLRAEGIDAVEAGDGAAAQALLAAERFDALVVDLRMPRMDGTELLSWMREAGPQVPAIVISAFGDVKDAVQAMKLGARDYLVKPFDPEELLLRVRRLLEEAALAAEAAAGHRAALPRDAGAATWLGDSPAMRAVRALVEKVAPTPSTVLITGESGTGKEVVARLVHALSPNAAGPFVPINVGGIPETLLESELFGYERGAFTGAAERKRGMLEVAGAGTVFLDEIGDMPLSLQVKLLRVLQDRRVQRLGGTQALPVAARIVAATNRDLEALLAQGRFREDLYYRLNVIRIEVPPLGRRREDIPRLAGLFLERLNRERGHRVKAISPGALARLANGSFPGNVRELENLVERAYILCAGDTITERDLGDRFAAPARRPRPGKLRDLERDVIEATLARHGGNRTATARELGISRRTLLSRLTEWGLPPRPGPTPRS